MPLRPCGRAALAPIPWTASSQVSQFLQLRFLEAANLQAAEFCGIIIIENKKGAVYYG